MKKGKTIPLLVLGMILTTTSVGSAASVGSFLEYYHSSAYRRLVTTTPTFGASPVSLKGQDYQYYKIYDANSKYTYSCDWKKLCTPFVYDEEIKSYHLSSISVAAQQGITWSSTTTKSFGTSLGVQSGYAAPSAVTSYAGTLSYSHTYSKSYTTTKSDSQTYTATFSQNTEVGLYYWAAVLYYDAYEYESYYKTAGSDTYKLNKRATFFTFKSDMPVIKFVRQNLP